MIRILTPDQANLALQAARVRLARQTLQNEETRLLSLQFAAALSRKVPRHDSVDMARGRAGVSGSGGANV